MATSNFKTMKDFPLYVDMSDDVDENGESIDFTELNYKLIGEALDKMNKNLVIMKMSVLGGYYNGFQLYAGERGEWYEADLEGKNKKEVLKREKAYILKCFDEIAKDFGLIKLSVVGSFSNGETIYKKVNDNEK